MICTSTIGVAWQERSAVAIIHVVALEEVLAIVVRDGLLLHVIFLLLGLLK
jgi:hypothetical protein